MIRVLEFVAPGCPYCAEQKRAKVMEQVAKLHPELLFERVNANKQPDLADECKVRAIPAYLVLEGEKILGKVEGAVGPERLSALIRRALKKKSE